MQNWTRLAKATVDAEFPHWEIKTSMSLFKLSKQKASHDFAKIGSTATTNIKRLAHWLDLNAAVLQSEYEDVRPIAARLFDQCPITTEEAWT